jgi:hypothetical protein
MPPNIRRGVPATTSTGFSSHIGVQVLHDFDPSAARPDRIRSRRRADTADGYGDLAPIKPVRHTITTKNTKTVLRKKKSDQETWQREFFMGAEEPPSPLLAPARPLLTTSRIVPLETAPRSPARPLPTNPRDTAPARSTPRWRKQVYQPPAKTSAASETKGSTSRFTPPLPLQQQKTKHIADSRQSQQHTEQQRDKSSDKSSSDNTSHTLTTQQVTEHDDFFRDDLSDITSEIYEEDAIISYTQSSPGRIPTSKTIPTEVSADKALSNNYEKISKPITLTSTLQAGVVDATNTAVVSSAGPTEIRPTTSTATPLDAKQEATAAKYRKMLQLKVPKEAVRHKMINDGVDPEIVKLVVGEDSTAPASPTPSIDCTRKDPAGAIPQHSSPSTKANKEESTNANVIANVTKLVPLHWTPLSGTDLDNSVWKANKRDNNSLPAQHPQSCDMTKLVELFQKKPTTCLPLDSKRAAKARSTPRANLLDITRCNNVAISLKAFKEFSHHDLRDIIAFVDPMQKIRGERIELLCDILPTVSEARKIKAYTGSEDSLVPTEMWFRQIARIQRLERKVQVIRTMEIFVSEAAVLDKKFQLLLEVCNQVMSSEKLQNLLELVLQVGNILNEGTRTGGAAGFKFDSLLKLTQTKSSDGKTTVLDFVVAGFASNGQRDSLKLSFDFPDCHAASRFLVSDLVSQVTALQHALQTCEKELNALKHDMSGFEAPQSPKGKTTFKPTKNSDSGDSRGQLMASLLSRRKEADTQEPKGGSRGQLMASLLSRRKEAETQEPQPVDTGTEKSTKRGLLLASIKQSKLGIAKGANGKSSGAAQCDESGTQPIDVTASDFQKNSIQGGIVRLEEFIFKGKEALAKLESSRTFTLDACRSLAEYCGEGIGAATVSSTLLGILDQFARNVDAALIKFDRQQKVETRRQKMPVATLPPTEDDGATHTSLDGGASATHASPPDRTAKPSGQDTSLVLLVNAWLNDADDRTRDDFRKGRILPHASEKLNAIYEKEKQSGTVGFVARRTQKAPWRSDLVFERDRNMEKGC